MPEWLRTVAARAAGIDRELRGAVDADLALDHAAAVDDQLAHGSLGVAHQHAPVGRSDLAAITDLPAALRVEGRLVDDDLDFVAAAGDVSDLAVRRSAPESRSRPDRWS